MKSFFFYGFPVLSPNVEIHITPCPCQGAAYKASDTAYAENQDSHESLLSEEIPNHVTGQIQAAPSCITAGGGHGHHVSGITVIS